VTGTAISLTGVGKRYSRHAEPPSLATSVVRLLRRRRPASLWAVRGLELQVDSGESVGLIGRNGSGKTTTLQLLCGVTAPTEGEVRVRGRIAPLISVGVGFHPELTGRENIAVNGAILGMSRGEVARRLDEIVDFSGIEPFLDTPTKFYSSGMTVRLGFSVAAHCSPEVLLVDEVLAVGDLPFQVKSFARMEQLQADGATVVVVSHNLTAVQRLCRRTVVMDGGRPVFDGATEDAISAYHDVVATADQGDDPLAVRHERDVLVVEDVVLLGPDGAGTAHVSAGDRLVARVRARVLRDVAAPFVVVRVDAADGQHVYRENNMLEPFPPVAAGSTVEWEVALETHLPTGSYAVRLAVARAAAGAEAGREKSLSDFGVLGSAPARMVYVTGRPMVHGAADLRGRFAVVDGTAGR